MAQKVWAVGEEVLAADFNNYVQNQVVPQFTNVAQRDSQWPAPPNGALCVTIDTATIWQRASGVWYRFFGKLDYAQATTPQGSVGGTTVDVTGLSVTIPAPGLRRVRIAAQIGVQSTVLGDVVRGDITDSSGSTTYSTFNVVCQAATAIGLSMSIVLIPPQGASIVYKLRVTRSIGTGTVTVQNSTVSPGWILAEDLGPS